MEKKSWLNKEPTGAILLPTGSAHEEIKGISHILEHILIGKFLYLNSESLVGGHTTEDYVILYCRKLYLTRIINTLKKIHVTSDELEFEKKKISFEIEDKSFMKAESFFRFVWQGTCYEKSPLGTADEVKRVSVKDIKDLWYQLLDKRWFFFSQEKGMEIVNKRIPIKKKETKQNIWLKKECIYRDKFYHIAYFSSRTEEMYLLGIILQALNPDNHIQLSEKRDQSALIMEKGTIFPCKLNITSLREAAIREVEELIIEIKNNFYEIALNELESHYFYDKPWSVRLETLKKTSEKQILDIIEELI